MHRSHFPSLPATLSGSFFRPSSLRVPRLPAQHPAGLLSPGGGAPVGGVVQGPAAGWRQAVRHAVDAVQDGDAVRVRFLG